MSAEPACQTYTPCYDWVIQATGSQATALTYGVVWRYAQMSGARCYASCERLAEHLAWTRQSVMRHLQRLVRLGLIVCANPGVPGVTREYLPVSQERWMAEHGAGESTAATGNRLPGVTVLAAGQAAQPETEAIGAAAVEVGAVASATPEVVAVAQTGEPVPTADTPPDGVTVGPVPSADTPCDILVQGPVPNADTRNTSRSTKKRQSGTPASRRDPRIVLLRKLTGRLPPAILHEQILSALGPSPAPERLTGCYRAWCARGYNPMNYAWLFDWYARGEIPPARSESPKAAAGGAAAAVNADLVAFSRWQAYQQAIQEGEQPDEVRRRLNL